MQKNLYFEDLRPGDCWTSPIREVTAEDVADFASLTGDHDPLHTDQLVDAVSPFGEPVAHGLLGLSILAGLSSTAPNVATLALIGVSDWVFEAPIFFGDVVHVVTRVADVSGHGRRAGRVTWLKQLVNQNNRVVQKGTFITLVAARVRQKRDAAPLITDEATLD
jgi:3-hydroxybutyryl-CoA dehydratase